MIYTKGSQKDLEKAHDILSSICYNHDENESFTDLALMVKNILDSWVESVKKDS